MAEAVSGAPAGAPQEGSTRPCNVRDQLCGLREAMEGKEELNSHFYELGLYQSTEKVPEGAQLIVGSVDATEHVDKERTDLWYGEKIAAAQLMLAILNNKPGKFDSATTVLINSKKPLLEKLAGQPASVLPAAFRTNFESGVSKEDLNGKEGIYNLVLAFQRICDFYKNGILVVPGADESSDYAWINTIQNDSRTLHLNIGSTVNNEKERYTKTYRTARVVLPPARPPAEPTIAPPVEQVPPTMQRPPAGPPTTEEEPLPPVGEDPNRARPLPPEVPEEPPAGSPAALPAAPPAQPPPPADPNAARPLPPDPE